MEGNMDMVDSDRKGVGCTPKSRASKACMWGCGWGRVGLAAIAVMAGVVATPVRAVATINPVLLPSADCPTNLASCTANDVTTTVTAVDILHNDVCDSLDDTIDLRITTAYEATSNQRFDLGLFVSGDGGTVQKPATAEVCFGAAAQVGQGDDNAYPDADTDLFLSLDPAGHSDTPNITDTCGDLGQSNPVNWTVDVTVACRIEEGPPNCPSGESCLVIPSCRVWE